MTVITGFLGAGKTTLLNKLLRDPALKDTAVIINEFGEVGLDHLLVEYIDDNVMLLQSGCLCCTMRGDLVDALETLLRDLDNRRCTFKRLVLETTGLADPAPVLHTAMMHPYLVMRYRLDGVVTLVDAVKRGFEADVRRPDAEGPVVDDDLDRPRRLRGGLACDLDACLAGRQATDPHVTDLAAAGQPVTGHEPAGGVDRADEHHHDEQHHEQHPPVAPPVLGDDVVAHGGQTSRPAKRSVSQPRESTGPLVPLAMRYSS